MGGAASVTRPVQQWTSDEVAAFLEADEYLFAYAEAAKASQLSGHEALTLDKEELGRKIGCDDMARVEVLMKLVKASARQAELTAPEPEDTPREEIGGRVGIAPPSEPTSKKRESAASRMGIPATGSIGRSGNSGPRTRAGSGNACRATA